MDELKVELKRLKDSMVEILAENRRLKEEELEIEIPITEYDIDLLKDMLANNYTVNWVYDDIHYNGRTVSVTLMSEDELEQRSLGC